MKIISQFYFIDPEANIYQKVDFLNPTQIKMQHIRNCQTPFRNF